MKKLIDKILRQFDYVSLEYHYSMTEKLRENIWELACMVSALQKEKHESKN